MILPLRYRMISVYAGASSERPFFHGGVLEDVKKQEKTGIKERKWERWQQDSDRNR